MTKKIAIFGYSYFTKEILCNIRNFEIFLTNEYYDKIINDIFKIEKYYKCKINKTTAFNPKKFKALITIPDFKIRKDIIDDLPKNTEFYTYIDKKSHIMDKNIIIGKGSIICSGTILTTNIKLGNFTHLNLNTTIGHDTNVGDFFTTAPGVNVSGNCNIGNNVYVGTNSSIREKIKICDNVVIGLNSGVVKNIEFPGIYAGTPCIKIK